MGIWTNKINEEQEDLRAQLQDILRTGIKNLQADLQEMDAAQRVKTLLQIAEYVLPKIERSGNTDAWKHAIFIDEHPQAQKAKQTLKTA